MQTPPVIESEPERLASLSSLAITRAREARFAELVELAAFLAHTPMATISIVENDEVWFKASIGLGAESVPRELSICGHTVSANETIVIPDTLLDDRFVDNPLVTDPPNVRFYAGVPLFVDPGLAVGTLCVMDTRPRTFLSDERRALEILARQVVGQLSVQRLEAAVEAGA